VGILNGSIAWSDGSTSQIVVSMLTDGAQITQAKNPVIFSGGTKAGATGTATLTASDTPSGFETTPLTLSVPDGTAAQWLGKLAPVWLDQRGVVERDLEDAGRGGVDHRAGRFGGSRAGLIGGRTASTAPSAAGDLVRRVDGDLVRDGDRSGGG
jgi:hypothetical protein